MEGKSLSLAELRTSVGTEMDAIAASDKSPFCSCCSLKFTASAFAVPKNARMVFAFVVLGGGLSAGEVR